MNKCLAIITARGGSKRIPRKNIKHFCGKPIIEYSIDSAISSGIFNEVMVSTDDEEIKSIALNAKASVPFLRSESTANDFATTSDVLLEVVNKYIQLGEEFDYLCCIYPTAPFITGERIKEAMNLLIKENADTVMPVVAFSSPPQRCFSILDNHLTYKWPENRSSRSQDLEKLYFDCGQFYCVNVKRFLETKQIVMEKNLPIILSDLETQDIDNETDWKLAELKYKLLNNII